MYTFFSFYCLKEYRAEPANIKRCNVDDSGMKKFRGERFNVLNDCRQMPGLTKLKSPHFIRIRY